MAIVNCAGHCGKKVMTAQNNLGIPRDEDDWYCDECFEKEKERREAQIKS
jgi:hypothetical protein